MKKLKSIDLPPPLPLLSNADKINQMRPAYIDNETSLDATLKEDAKEVYVGLVMVHLGWQKATSVEDVCALAKATTNLLVERRKLLMLPYGTEGNNSRDKGDALFSPVA